MGSRGVRFRLAHRIPFQAFFLDESEQGLGFGFRGGGGGRGEGGVVWRVEVN